MTVTGPDALDAAPGAELDSGRAWLVAGASFLSTFTVFAPAYSFGVFFEAMEDTFDASKGATAFVFSIATFLYFLGGVVSGRVGDRVGPRPVVLFGAVVMAAGLALTAAAPTLWLAYITYGLGVGIGVACGYVPMVAPVGAWFVRRRTFAMGVAVAGIGCSWLVAPPLVAWIIDAHGWRAAYVVLAVVTLVLLGVASLGTAPPPGGGGGDDVRPVGEIFRLPGFRVLYAAGFIGTLALFTPFVFLVPYATDHGISDGAAAALLAVLGGTSVVGRLGLGALGANRVVRIYQGCFLALGLSFVLWLVAGSSYVVLVAFSVVLGLGYGGFIALGPALAAHLFGLRGLGGVLGAMYTSAGFGGLIGPPFAGLLTDLTGSYTAAIVAALCFGLVAFALLLRLDEHPSPG
ncbi:MAG: MFS transporter [Actinomycetota bacterium]|nr:MFS transporter [Actinomycetota bacterium]